ncbi:ABC transporter permease [Runella zeae]|uniref:ABC transporter permease n=1 Tax=Runella zeae TaxID=94255 RepID=UPI000428F3B2|nr:ABC transporter permease [Runella zeae]
MQNYPPRWADRLLTFFCAPHLLEEVQGDLHERYQRQLALFGEKIARRQYVWNVLSFIRPFALKRKKSEFQTTFLCSPTMLINYLKVAFRNLVRHKTFSSLNVFGLTVGTVCCLYILAYVKDQFGYDTYHKDAENIYRLRTNIVHNGGDQPMFNSCTSGPVIAPTMKKDLPEVVEYTRALNFFTTKNNVLGVVGKTETFIDDKGFLVDSTFFNVFTYRFTEGSPEHSLDAPYTAVLSKTLAKKMFGDEKAINKRIKVGSNINTTIYTVTGVYDDNFGKSHLKPSFLVSLNSGGLGEFARNNTEWGGNNFIYSYVKLKPHVSPESVNTKIAALLQRYGGKRIAELGMQKKVFLEKITDIHLYSKGVTNQAGKVSDISFLYILLTIAAFIQLIACINFVNLTTARSVRRAKEVGVRKAVGAFRSVLIGQFLGESMLIAFISIFLALPIVQLLLPFLNSLTDSALELNVTQNVDILVITVSVALLTGLLAGIYPAIYLSSFKPVSVLKGTFKFNPTSVVLRKGLVVFQFSIAIVLIIGVLVISKQLDFMQNKDLGFNQKQKIVISLSNENAQGQFTALKNELLNQHQIKNIGGVRYYPSQSFLQDMLVFKSGGSMDKGVLIKNNVVDEGFLKTLGIKLIAGRNFTPADTNNQVILSEKSVRDLNLTLTTAVGTEVFTGAVDNVDAFRVIGVYKDYINNSLKEEIKPVMMHYNAQPEYMVLEVQSDNYDGLMANVEQTWKKLIPGFPLQYSFLDEEIQKQYVEEKTLRKIINSFTFIAILISCLGLFGLAMFTAEQRTKEIGVRKVLGASVLSITTLLSKEFLKPVVVALLIASPLSYYAMNKWLESFVYRTEIGWGSFAVAGIAIVAISLFTVSYQTLKAALINPVTTLKSE